MAATDLRKFEDVDDLFDNIDNSIILEWVNAYATVKVAQRAQGKRYRMKQHIMAKLAEQYLEKDEIQRVRDEVAGEVEDESI